MCAESLRSQLARGRRSSALLLLLVTLLGVGAFSLNASAGVGGDSAIVRPVDWHSIAVCRLASPSPEGSDLALRIRDAGGRMLVHSGEWAWIELPEAATQAFLASGLATEIHRDGWLGPYSSLLEASAAGLLAELTWNNVAHGDPFARGPAISLDYPDTVLAEPEDTGPHGAGFVGSCYGDYSEWPPMGESFLGRTHVMQGTVLATFFFVESNPSGPENYYSWSSSTANTVLSKIQTALIWWAGRASVRGRNLSFSFEARSNPEHPECLIPWEPTAHPPEWVEQYYVPHIMNQLGIVAGTGNCAVGLFNDAQRGSYDRTFSAFLVTGERHFDWNRSTRFAWAYKNGPYLVSTAEADNWGIAYLDAVLAHEMGHIFRACDEYPFNGTSGCQSCQPCILGAESNGNCGAGCGSTPCVMQGEADLDSPCSYTADQIGWDEYRPPTRVSPPDDTTLSGAPITLRVSPAFGATRHRFELARDRGFTCMVLSEASPLSEVTTPPLADCVYYWRAFAGDTLTRGESSGIGRFRVGDVPWEEPLNQVAIVTGPGSTWIPTSSLARLFQADGTPLCLSFEGFPGSTAGLKVATGDVDGDGRQEIIVGSGSAPPMVKVLRPDGRLLSGPFEAYPGGNHGVSVAAGDLDGDGVDEIITGAASTSPVPSHVRAFRADGSPLSVSFSAFPTYNAGINVAAGDWDGDGRDEIVAGMACCRSRAAVFRPDGTQLYLYTIPFVDCGFTVAAGDLDGNGTDEIILGVGPTGCSFMVFAMRPDHSSFVNFLAFPGFSYGVTVAAGDLDGDGIDEIVVGKGPNAADPPEIRAFRGDGTPVGASFFAYQNMGGGVNVAVGDFAQRCGVGGGSLGTVNSGAGLIGDVLRINGNSRSVTSPVGGSIEIALAAAPEGSGVGAYVMWTWVGPPVIPRELVLGGETIGCTVNPTPLHRPSLPQPLRCMRSSQVPSALCAGVRELVGPVGVPWTLNRASGLNRPGVFTMQGVIRDMGAANLVGYSVTNAVVLTVQ